MDLKLYQIAITILSIIMISQGVKNFIRGGGGQTWLKLLVRILVWGGMTIIVLFPTLTNEVARFIGIVDNVNAVILTGFIFVFLIIFKLLSAIERLEQQITACVREKALNEMIDNDRT